MANTYWHNHPRGFANECTIIRATTQEEAEWLKANGFERLSRHELGQHVRWLNAENDSWGSGRAFGPINLRQITNPEIDDHGQYSLREYMRGNLKDTA